MGGMGKKLCCGGVWWDVLWVVFGGFCVGLGFGGGGGGGMCAGTEGDLGLELEDAGVGEFGFGEGLVDDLDVFGGGDADVGAELLDFVEEVSVGVLKDLDGALAFGGNGGEGVSGGGGLGGGGCGEGGELSRFSSKE